MSDLVVNIPAVTVTAEKPKLTTREDFTNLKRYADAFRRGEIGRDKIPYKYRAHLPETQEKAQGIAYQQHKDDEKAQEILKQQGWDKLEKAYGIGMSSLVAVPALSQVAASAVPGWTPPTPTFNPANFVPFGQSGGMGTYVLKQLPAMTGGMIGNEIVQGVARRNGYDGFADWMHRGVFKNENKPGFLASTGYEFLNPGNYVGGWAGNKANDVVVKAMDHVPTIPKRVAEVFLRIGDEAGTPAEIKKQLLNKNAFKFLFVPGNDNLVYKLPYNYSGANALMDSAPAHYGDLIDVGLGKTSFYRAISRDGAQSIDFPVTTVQNEGPFKGFYNAYIRKAYPNRQVKYVDFGDLNREVVDMYHPTTPTATDAPNIDLYDEAKGVFSLVDPGGHYRQMIGNTGYGTDIYKFNPGDYSQKYFAKLDLLREWFKKRGLRFLDKHFDPIVTTWKYKVKTGE